ncbi:MAG: ABC transporter substrate-binding protein [Actinobacteria bacterium]|nr:ABC transporter substrate-binding protein [Actinomycetota bacterium]
MSHHTPHDRRVSRRETLQLGGALALGLTGLAGCGGGGSSGGGSKGPGVVRVGTWGGDYTAAQRKAYFAPFEAQTGIKVETVESANLNAAAIKAFEATGNFQWDVTDIAAGEYQTAVDHGWLESIDYDVVKAGDKTPERQFKQYGVCAESISDVIVYRSDVFRSGGPRSWADVWDTGAFPGPRLLWKNPYPALEGALLADGVAPQDLYPLDLDRALKRLDAIKDDVAVWFESGSQSQQVIANKNAVLGSMWSGRAAQSRLVDKVPVEISWNQGIYTPSIYVVPKGAPNAVNAMKLIDFMAGAKPLARFAELTFYGPTNLKSLPHIDPATRKLMNTDEANLSVQFERDHAYWARNLDAVTERFTAWLTS